MKRRKILALSLSALIFFSVAAAATIASAVTGQTTRVSVDSAGFPASSGASFGALSANGRYVVFQSSAADLVGVVGTHVYRHDRVTHGTVLVDVATSGGPSTGPAVQPTVSADGRFVAFGSFANDLIAGATNPMQDVFVRDMEIGITKLVSASSTGAPGDLSSSLSTLPGVHQISDDGSFVVFLSSATNLVAGANGRQQVYVKDLTDGTVVRASVNDGGQAGNTDSFAPAISGDGLVVAFQSASTNFTSVSPLNTTQIFVRDLGASTPTTMLESPAAAAAGRSSTAPALSFDGRYLAFESAATLDVRDRDNGTIDVFLRDRAANTTVLASLSDLAVGGATSAGASISGDGRWVGFSSLDDQLIGVAADMNGLADVFLYDRNNQTVTLVSLNDDGQQATGVHPREGSGGASVSSDGRSVLFTSNASDLVSSPSTGSQIYVRSPVSNQAPVLPAFGTDYALFEGQSMRLTWEFSDNDASTSWSATVNWGDGSVTEDLVLEGKRFFLEHMWTPGSHDVTVEVTDEAGAIGSLVIHVVVSNVAPTVGLLSTLDLAFSRTLDASGTFTDPGAGTGETYSATVNYGDGTGTQTLPLDAGSFSLHHVYTAAGSYTVAVTVSDSGGDTTTATLALGVGAYRYEWLDPVASAFVVGRNLPVKFMVLGPDGSFVLDRSVRVDVVDGSGVVAAGPYSFGDQPSRSVTWNGDYYHANVDTKDLAPGMYWLRVRFSSDTLAGEFTLATNGTTSAVRSRLRD